MSASKHQIVNGIAGYIHDEIIPKMGKDKALQISLSVAVNAVKANESMIDTVFENETVKAILEENGKGEYEITDLMDELRASVEKYGELPLEIPAIPLIAPHGATIRLDASDIAAIKRRIEAAEEE